MIVQGHLMARLESRLGQFAERMETWAERVQTWAGRMDTWVNATENRLAQTGVRMVQLEERHNAVIERLDRFIAGQQGNGQHRCPGDGDTSFSSFAPESKS